VVSDRLPLDGIFGGIVSVMIARDRNYFGVERSFAAISIPYSIVYCYFAVPETKNISLESISRMLDAGVSVRRFPESAADFTDEIHQEDRAEEIILEDVKGSDKQIE
jgi:hypothetical protein